VSEQPANGGAFASVPAEIVQVELLGAETILAARITGVERDVMARVGATSQLKVGARCALSLDLAALHLFDAAGEAIAPKE
jgi:ABC-type sugar transport system ATPase subunit